MSMKPGQNNKDPEGIFIRTSDSKWFESLARAYKKRLSIKLIDDAGVGIEPAKQTLLDMGKQARLGKSQWAGVLVSLGMSGIGIWMIVAAIHDPEPTSKLGLLIVGGSVCILGGGFSAIRILTKLRPPSVTAGKGGFKIEWD